MVGTFPLAARGGDTEAQRPAVLFVVDVVPPNADLLVLALVMGEALDRDGISHEVEFRWGETDGDQPTHWVAGMPVIITAPRLVTPIQRLFHPTGWIQDARRDTFADLFSDARAMSADQRRLNELWAAFRDRCFEGFEREDADRDARGAELVEWLTERVRERN